MDFHRHIDLKYHLYNSLFLRLPFEGIAETGTLLPLFALDCERGLKNGLAPRQIVENFWADHLEQADEKARLGLLFRFIQYIERQVVLFDAVEDAAFSDTHDLAGVGSAKHFLTRAAEKKLEKKAVEKLRTYAVRLVLTAHPTQFYPGKVLGIINDLGHAIRENDSPTVEMLLLQLGKTAFVNRERPTPFDEAVALGWFLENVFYTAMPELAYKMLHGLGQDPVFFENPSLVQLGFWPGGDRDGNPFVVSETTLSVAKRLKETILRCYFNELRAVRRRLTFEGVEEILQRAENRLRSTVLENAENEHFSTADQFLELLFEARKNLVEQHQSLFLELLDRLILKVRMFGFHFASLDVRQEQSKHTLVWQAILSKIEARMPSIFSVKKYESWPEAEKMNFLLTLGERLEEADFEDEFVRETLRSFRTIEKIQAENGELGCHRYIISGCGAAISVAEVLGLARLLFSKNESKSAEKGSKKAIPLDVVPLFETIDDLAKADEVMKKLYSNAEYAAHLASRKNVQPIMLGFSDGTKDGGYLRANWSIFRAKEALTKISREHGVSVVFFDGRGGPPGRGGGNNASYYAAHGAEIEGREIQVTIQGQTISSTYGTPEAALFNAERLFTAGLETAIFGGNAFDEREKIALDELANAAYVAYLKLKNSEDFVPYLEKMTPLRFYGLSNIASRPAKRSSGSLRFEDLRAIPFVGAWALMKQNVPGFFGFGSGIEAMKKMGKKRLLNSLWRDSLFFRTLAENSMQSLSKANYAPTRYLETHPEFGDFWKKLLEEFERTKAALAELSGSDELLAQNPASKESIRLREEIVLPLIVIQQFALQKLEKDAENEAFSKLVVRAMFGIINAARNSA